MIHGNGIEDVCLHGRHLFCNLHHMIIIDAGNDNRIDLDGHVFRLEPPDRLLLIFKNDLGGIRTPIDLTLQPGPGIYLLPDSGVDGVDRHGDMADLQTRQIIHVVCHGQTVCGNAEHHLRVSFPDQTKRLHGLDRIGEGVSGTGYSHYGYIFDPIQDIVEIIRRLPGQ